MKKILAFIVIIAFLPLVVKADMGPLLFSSEVSKSDSEVYYSIKYTSTGDVDGVDGHSNVVYLKYDASKLEYQTIEEYLTNTNSKLEVQKVSTGVLKVLFNVPGKDKSFEVKARLTFKAIGSGETSFELKSQVKYEKAGCVTGENDLNACDDDYSGQVLSASSVQKIDLGQNNNTVVNETSKSDNTDSAKKEFILDIILDYSLILNAVLLALILTSKKRNANN